MDFRLISRLVWEKLHDLTTYVLAAIVGTLINGYGHLLVPWFRIGSEPFSTLWFELQLRPGLTSFSMFLAYLFPFCVGVYSAVAARYKNRRIESIADFPERKPDPVFRATKGGQLVEIGATTQKLFDEFQVDKAQHILGDEVWGKIVSNEHSQENAIVFFEPEGVEYMVRYAATTNNHINVYLTRLGGSPRNN